MFATKEVESILKMMAFGLFGFVGSGHTIAIDVMPNDADVNKPGESTSAELGPDATA